MWNVYGNIFSHFVKLLDPRLFNPGLLSFNPSLFDPLKSYRYICWTKNIPEKKYVFLNVYE